MADKIKVKLLRPLNGEEVGTTAEYDAADAKRLEATGAVKLMSSAKAEAKATETKMEAAPENKAVSAATAPVRAARRGK